MAQQYKKDKVKKLKEYFEFSEDILFTDYRGLNVEKITELRRELDKLSAKYVVVKNNFIKVIADEKEYPDLGDNLVGPTAIVFTKKDPNEIAKVLVNFTKDTELDIKGAMIDKKVMGRDEVIELSKLPGREQLLGMLLSTLNAPVQNFAYACNDVMGRTVRVLNAVKEQKEAS